MPILDFLNDPDWDSPFFKVLAHNDTGSATGHQSGMVFPSSLRQYLPELQTSQVSISRPTVDRRITADLFIESTYICSGALRYQIQTWHGTRRPESRITDGFSPIRNRASSGDILVFQRYSLDLVRYRLILIRRSTPEFNEITNLVAGRKWGCLDDTVIPISQSELQIANQELNAIALEPFIPIRPDIPRHESRNSRIARSTTFREIVRREYGYRCAVTGIGIETPYNLYEVQAIHVIPISEHGQDDPRNGISLCQTMHWAFDRGLFGIDPDSRRVIIPDRVRDNQRNYFLLQYENRQIAETTNTIYRIQRDALTWHYEHKVQLWE